jgi:cytochrome c-type protein NapC
MFEEKKGLVGRVWARVKRIGPWTVVGLFALGIAFWGGFNWTLELTNTEAFCISCHEMQQNVFKEYQYTVLHQPPACGRPADWRAQAWHHKMVRKIRPRTTRHHLLGTVDRPRVQRQAPGSRGTSGTA